MRPTKQLNYDFLECARKMPNLRHSRPNKEYDVMASQVAWWLCMQPSVRQKIFEMAQRKGLIVYDPETGTWRGIDNA